MRRPCLGRIRGGVRWRSVRSVERRIRSLRSIRTPPASISGRRTTSLRSARTVTRHRSGPSAPSVVTCTQLADWLHAVGITTVAMESTGVYWIPVFEILEARGFEVVLVNARDVKQVPGRKTDVNDAQWLQQLHQFGLLRGSFRPREAVVQLRAYLRLRERLIEYAAAHIQHMQKA